MPTESLRPLIGDGWIGPVHCDGCEILRRIFVTVRDRNWLECRPTQFEFDVDEPGRTVHLRARHTSELVDFEWQGELVVGDGGRDLRFAFRGHALRHMQICRLGLIVLHPVEGMVGSRIKVSDGQFEQSRTIGQPLAPQPIVQGIPGAMTEPFTRLSIEREAWGQLFLSFSGDSFELEDQRNWGDASFKTYCTPLRKGFPRAVERGTSVAQSVELRFTPSQKPASVTTTRDEEARPRLARLPAIGRVWRAGTAQDATRDQDTSWDHLHVDLVGQEASALRRLLESAQAGQFEIALGTAVPTQTVLGWAAHLREHRERIARVLCYGLGTSLPSAQSIEVLNEALDGSTAGRAIPLFAATRGYFVEINRLVPFSPSLTGVAFPLTATVHSDDPDTLMSNVRTVRDMAETARCLTGNSEIGLTPLALYHPPAAAPTRLSREIVLTWLAATVWHAAAARVASITLADDLIEALQAGAGTCSAETVRRLMASEHRGVRITPAGHFPIPGSLES